MAKEVDRARLVFERASIHAANGELFRVCSAHTSL
jgi:hypothetical protein